MNFKTGAVFELFYAGQEVMGLYPLMEAATPDQVRAEFENSGQQGRLQSFGFEWVAIMDGSNMIGAFIPDTVIGDFEAKKEQWAEEISAKFFPELLVYFEK